MKIILVVLVALATASCIITKLEPVELCTSSPQQFNNAVNCNTQDTHKKQP